MITVTFDPDNVFTPADVAREMGVSGQSVREWLNRNADIIPPPLFTLRMPRVGMTGDMHIKVWDVKDFTKLLAVYRERREKWDATRSG